ncbi:MAG TPA: hypothetical protein VMQ93_16240 [Novosphingobium sp.]|nr:hypothetical protein [Novosphingobium sp.]
MQIADSAADLIAIHEAFAFPIVYSTVGPITAVEMNDDASGMDGATTLRTRRFEILQSKLPAPPAKNDRIDASGRAWYVTESERRDDVLAWHVTVEWRT